MEKRGRKSRKNLRGGKSGSQDAVGVTMAHSMTEEEVREVRFRCLDLAITACRDNVGRASSLDQDVLTTAKEFEAYVIRPETQGKW